MKKLTLFFLLFVSFASFAQNEEFKSLFQGDKHVLSLLNTLGEPENPALQKQLSKKLNVDWKVAPVDFAGILTTRHQIRFNDSINSVYVSEGTYLRYKYFSRKRVADKSKILKDERLWVSKSKMDEIRATGLYQVGQSVPLESFRGVLKSNDFVFLIKVKTDELYANNYYLVSEIDAFYHKPTAIQLAEQFDKRDAAYADIKELCAASEHIDRQNLPLIKSNTPKINISTQDTHYGQMIWKGALNEAGLPSGYGQLSILNLSDCNVANVKLAQSENEIEYVYAINGAFHNQEDFITRLFKEQPYEISGFSFPKIPTDYISFCYENCTDKYEKVIHFGGFVWIGSVDEDSPKAGYLIPTNKANYQKITLANFKTWGKYYRMGFSNNQFTYAVIIPENAEASYRIESMEEGIGLRHYPINEKRRIYFYGKLDSLGRKQGNARLAISNGSSRDMFYVVSANFIDDVIQIDRSRYEEVSTQKLNRNSFTFQTQFDKPETSINLRNYFNQYSVKLNNIPFDYSNSVTAYRSGRSNDKGQIELANGPHDVFFPVMNEPNSFVKLRNILFKNNKIDLDFSDDYFLTTEPIYNLNGEEFEESKLRVVATLVKVSQGLISIKGESLPLALLSDQIEYPKDEPNPFAEYSGKVKLTINEEVAAQYRPRESKTFKSSATFGGLLTLNAKQVVRITNKSNSPCKVTFRVGYLFGGKTITIGSAIIPAKSLAPFTLNIPESGRAESLTIRGCDNVSLLAEFM